MHARARARKIFPNFSDVRPGGGGLDQKFLKDTPQFCRFSSVVHAEFCWICGLFPSTRAREFFSPQQWWWQAAAAAAPWIGAPGVGVVGL